MSSYDLVVIGGGPAGEKAAVKAAYFGHRVALVEKEQSLGGAAVNTGTLPSKTLKETALFLSGKSDKGLYGVDRKLESEASIEQFMFRKNHVAEVEAKEVEDNVLRHGVTLYKGTARFMDAHTVQVSGKDEIQELTGRYILIATGSYPFHPPAIPFDSTRVLDSDSILQIPSIPGSIVIVGAGVIGIEYATIFATMGVKVTLINSYDLILPFLDQEITETLIQVIEKSGVSILFNETLESLEKPNDEKSPLKVHLKSGKSIETPMFLFAAGRRGCSTQLGLDKIGIKVDQRELIQVNQHFQTSIPHIYAAGDVIGFPSLSSTSMDQGRVAVAHMFETRDTESLARLLPFGIYTIPEVSTVGLSEEQAQRERIEVFTGKAWYNDLPRGRIMGANHGLMKIVFAKEDLRVLGVHIVGAIATELIHYGMTLIEGKKTIYDVISMVFNYPTLHELYKYACYDGLGTLSGHKVKIHKEDA